MNKLLSQPQPSFPSPSSLCTLCYAHRPLGLGSLEPCPVGRTLAHLRVPLLLPGVAALCATCRRCARKEKAVPARQSEQTEKRRSLRDEKMAPTVILRSFSRLLAPARLPSCCECLFRPIRPSAYPHPTGATPGISVGGGGRSPGGPAVTFTVREPGSPLLIISRQLSSKLTPDLCEWILRLLSQAFQCLGDNKQGDPSEAASRPPTPKAMRASETLTQALKAGVPEQITSIL